jgi:hypothetical protein
MVKLRGASGAAIIILVGISDIPDVCPFAIAGI